MGAKELTEKDAAAIKVGDQVVMNGKDCAEKGAVGVVEFIESPLFRAREFVVRLPDDEDGPNKVCVTVAEIESFKPASTSSKPKAKR